jgi:hypothetical protein
MAIKARRRHKAPVRAASTLKKRPRRVSRPTGKASLQALVGRLSRFGEKIPEKIQDEIVHELKAKNYCASAGPAT